MVSLGKGGEGVLYIRRKGRGREKGRKEKQVW